jgi:Flp pilus assembly protein TadB/Mg-chelatase subunit ChlD
VVIRRIAAGLVAAAAMILAVPGTAHADSGLTVKVAAVSPGTVRLIALADPAVGGDPPVTVSQGGKALSTKAEVVHASAPNEARGVVAVVDAGATMAGAPLQAARQAVLGFVEAVPDDVQVGVVAAAETPTVVLAPTADRAGLGPALATVRAAGPGRVVDALTTAANLLTGYQDGRLLVLIDGANAAGGGSPTGGAGPTAPAKSLATAGVQVDVVEFRRSSTAPDALRQLATATGGATYQAATANALPTVFRTAAASLGVRLNLTVTVPARLAGVSGSLTVSVGTGPAKRTTTVPVVFAAPPLPPPGTSARVPWSFLRPSGIAVVVFVVVLVAALLVTSPLRRPVRPRRLSQVNRFRLAGRDATQRGSRAGPVPDGGPVRTLRSMPSRLAGGRGKDQRATATPDEAGASVTPALSAWWWIGVIAGAAVLLGLLGGLVGALIGILVGLAAVLLYRRYQEGRRQRMLADQLPDALQLIVGSLKSGFSLAQAIDAVGRDLPPGPLAFAFRRVAAENRIGADIGDALERGAEWLGSEDLAWVVMAVRIQRDSGGNLAEILETTVETLRERERLRRHVWALSAEGRLSAYILIALPILMAGWMFFIRRSYLTPLWTTPLGLLMLIGAVVLVVIGSFWISRWVKVEV